MTNYHNINTNLENIRQVAKHIKHIRHLIQQQEHNRQLTTTIKTHKRQLIKTCNK